MGLFSWHYEPPAAEEGLAHQALSEQTQRNMASANAAAEAAENARQQANETRARYS